MQLFPEDSSVVLYETGFDDDALNRKKLSGQLSDLVDRLDNPTVLALDDPWGTGKTYFLKRWVAAHQSENSGKATTVYFDAFQNDYLSDPLVSIISTVEKRLPRTATATIERWKTAAGKLIKPTLGIALSLLTLGAQKHLDDAGDAIAEVFHSETKDHLSDIWSIETGRKQALEQFKSLLSDLTKEIKTPLVIVIDELDRCRPDYALSVLEIIKHLFSVPQVHFILGINAVALQSSVKARYGAEIDAAAYLKKFVNLSFSLPRRVGDANSAGAAVQYATTMGAKMGLPDRVLQRCIQLMKVFDPEKPLSLRDTGKLLTEIALLPEAASNPKLLPGRLDCLCVLLVSKHFAPTFYSRYLNGNLLHSEVQQFLNLPDEGLQERVSDEYNPKFDYEKVFWYVNILFSCNPRMLREDQYPPEFNDRAIKAFYEFGYGEDRAHIPTVIQRDWIDLFRL